MPIGNRFSMRAIHRIWSIVLFWIFLWSGCTTIEVVPPLPPNPPVYTQVPHPVGFDLGDLAAIFTDPSAPPFPDFAKTCDQDFRKLVALTVSKKELARGVEELVKKNPAGYHWCFYGKLLLLENELKEDTFVDIRQKKVLETFEFLAPVARAFVNRFYDSRYLRWTVNRYQKISSWIFYRNLALTPKGTLELVDASRPFGVGREPVTDTDSILEKYHIGMPNATPLGMPSPMSYASSTPEPHPEMLKDATEAVLPSPSPSPEAPAPAPVPIVSGVPSLDPNLIATPTPSPSPVPVPPTAALPTALPQPIREPAASIPSQLDSPFEPGPDGK